jgi:hypothetical protein
METMTGKTQGQYRGAAGGISPIFAQTYSTPGSFALPIILALSEPLRDERRPSRSDEEFEAAIEAEIEERARRRASALLPRLLKRLFRYEREVPMAAR